jgi:hypothetical protein
MYAIRFSEWKTELQRAGSDLHDSGRVGERDWTVTNHMVSSQFTKTTQKREVSSIKIGDKWQALQFMNTETLLCIRNSTHILGKRFYLSKVFH